MSTSIFCNSRFFLFLFIPIFTGCGGGGGNDGRTPSSVPEAEVVLNLPGPGDFNNYFPNTTGNYWHFQGFIDNTISYNNSVSTTGTRDVNGVFGETFLETNTYAVGSVTENYMFEDLNGIANLGNNTPGDPFQAGSILYWELQFPLSVGEKFVQLDRKNINLGEDLDGDNVSERFDIHSEVTVEALEALDVPAGSFDNVFRIHRKSTLSYILSSDTSRIPAVSNERIWLAPNVGWIKRSITVVVGGVSETEIEELDAYQIDGTTVGLTDLQADFFQDQVQAGARKVYSYPVSSGDSIFVYVNKLSADVDLIPYLPDHCVQDFTQLSGTQSEGCMIKAIDQRIVFAVEGKQEADFSLTLSTVPNYGTPSSEGSSTNPVMIAANALIAGSVETRGTSYYVANGLALGDHEVSILAPTGEANLHVYMDDTYSLELDCTLRDQANTCTVANTDAVYFSISSGPINRDGANYLIFVSD